MASFIDKFLTWASLNLGWFISALYWRIGNRVTVIGQLPKTGPLITIANHQLFTDSFLIGCTVDSWWTVLSKPQTALWHCPAFTYVKNPIARWLAKHLHCLPVYRTTGKGHEPIKLVLQRGGRISIFPASGLQTKGTIERRPPVLLGKLIYETKPTVVPIHLTGLPIWNGQRISLTTGWWKKFKLFNQRAWPGFGRRITLTIEPPLDLSGFWLLPNTEITWRLIADKLVQAIKTPQT